MKTVLKKLKFRFYLIDALVYSGDKLLTDHINKFHTRFIQSRDLLFHYGFKGQVWSEQTSPDPMDISDSKRDLLTKIPLIRLQLHRGKNMTRSAFDKD